MIEMYKYNKKFFNKIDTEEKAYWAGFIAADGNIRKDFLKMRIELNIRDYSHLEKFKKSIEGNNPIKEAIRPNNHSCYIDVNCKEFCSALNELGITPKKSLTLQIKFELIPRELRNHFIRGYFDGDGSINKYQRDNKEKPEWEISFISSKFFLEQILKELNKEKKLYSCGNNFRISFKAKQDIKDIINYLYNNATIYMNRKKEKANEFKALNDYQGATN